VLTHSGPAGISLSSAGLTLPSDTAQRAGLASSIGAHVSTLRLPQRYEMTRFPCPFPGRSILYAISGGDSMEKSTLPRTKGDRTLVQSHQALSTSRHSGIRSSVPTSWACSNAGGSGKLSPRPTTNKMYGNAPNRLTPHGAANSLGCPINGEVYNTGGGTGIELLGP
jgi:hypothetical protein